MIIGSTNGWHGIAHGDSKNLCSYIDCNSIDMIATDPPYHKKHHELYEWLGVEGCRILKPGGFAAVMTGSSNMVAAVNALTRKMSLYYVFGIYIPGSKAGIVWPHGHQSPIISRLKYMIVVQKPGKRAGASSVMYSPLKPGSKDKRHHKWGQDVSIFKQLVEAFSSSGDIVLDPFGGGGTTAVACMRATDKNGKGEPRRWLLIDNDANAVNVARRRIMGESLPPMLRLLSPAEQKSLIG